MRGPIGISREPYVVVANAREKTETYVQPYGFLAGSLLVGFFDEAAIAVDHYSAHCRVCVYDLQHLGNDIPKLLAGQSPEANIRVLFQLNRLERREDSRSTTRPSARS